MTILQYFVSLEDIPKDAAVTIDIATCKVRRVRGDEHVIGHADEDIPSDRRVALTDKQMLIYLPGGD